MFHMGSSSFQAGTLTAAAALRQTSRTSAQLRLRAYGHVFDSAEHARVNGKREICRFTGKPKFSGSFTLSNPVSCITLTQNAESFSPRAR